MWSIADDKVLDEDDNDNDGEGGLLELLDKREYMDNPRGRSARWYAQVHGPWFSTVKVDCESRVLWGRGPCTREGFLKRESPSEDDATSRACIVVVGIVLQGGVGSSKEVEINRKPSHNYEPFFKALGEGVAALDGDKETSAEVLLGGASLMKRSEEGY